MALEPDVALFADNALVGDREDDQVDDDGDRGR